VATSKSLGWVLDNVESLPWQHALYLRSDRPWTLDTPVLVLDPDDANDDEDEPTEARLAGLRYALGIQDVRGVIENARQQRPASTQDDLLRALIYYFEHDAFIDFSR
jgi:hypothetical protein